MNENLSPQVSLESPSKNLELQAQKGTNVPPFSYSANEGSDAEKTGQQRNNYLLTLDAVLHEIVFACSAFQR